VTTDAELIARVLTDDDRTAFGALIERHQPLVRGLLHKVTGGDAARADDLAQEAFLRAYRGLATYRGGAQLSSWLCRIALNLFLSEARRKPDPELADPIPEATSPEQELEDRHDLEGALAQLRAEERVALALTFREELTHEEAAARMHWPLGTLKTHVWRAKRKLRDLLSAPAPCGGL